MMKIVLAFDKFKGVASSSDLSMAAQSAIREAYPDAQVDFIPCADGGEGTVRALSARGATEVEMSVCGPLPDMRVRAAFSSLGCSAVVEMAAASGLALLSAGRRDVMRATTLGTGELIRHAISRLHAEHITLGIGGTASNDCGMGILLALGFRFLDSEGCELPPCGESLIKVAKVDDTHVPPMHKSATYHLVTDVRNPLCGPDGAAQVYAPQKGATPEQVRQLEEGACHFAKFMPEGVADAPGAGAGGGTAAGLMAFLGARVLPGAEAVLRAYDFDHLIADADLVITGEGRIDASTSFGKVPYAVAKACRTQGVPVAALCGILDGAAPEVFTAVRCVNPAPINLQEALQPDVCLKRVASSTVKIIKTILE